MPALQCQECGKELLPSTSGNKEGYCLCSACGREVYFSTKKTVEVACPKCGEKNKTRIAV